MHKPFPALLTLACACLALGQDITVEKYRLGNGMTVILHEDHSLPVVAVNLWYHVGSKDEPPHRTGFAHLFEHLMFTGTKRVPKFDFVMEGGGGQNNASTTEDRTNYYDSGPSNLLPTLLWLEADRMEGLGAAMDQKKLDLQREVVKNERREDFDNAPYGPAHLAIDPIMYPVGHPYHIPVMGLNEDLNAATVQDVKDFFSTYYVPNNVSMVVAGDFATAQVKPLIAKLFGTLPRRDDPIHRMAPPTPFEGVQRVTMVDKVQVPKVIMVWHSAPAYSHGDIMMNLTGSILADGVSSRLYQKLVVERNLASDVTAMQDSRMLGSLFSIEVTATPNASLDDVENTVDGVLADYVKDGPSALELKSQAARIEYGTLSNLQNIEDVADSLNEYEYFLGEPNSFRRVLDLYRSASTRDVRDEARATLRPDARLILRVIPEVRPLDVGARDTRPTDWPPKDFPLQKPAHFKLSNGIAVSYWREPELPIMQVCTVFKDPGLLNPPARAGLTALTARMLDQGGGKFDPMTFDNALSLIGSDVSVSSTRRGILMSLSALESKFDKALDYYATAMRSPRFDPGDWERVLSDYEEGLSEGLDDPITVARHVSSAELFPATSPYAMPGEGTTATVKSLRLDDVKATYGNYVNPRTAAIFAAGSLDEDTCKAMLEKHLGSWSSGEVKGEAPPTATEPHTDGLKVFVVDKPGASQTVIRFLLPAPNSGDPGRLALRGLSAVLGGVFTSRLNNNLREQHGYTYGAGSDIAMDPWIGLFVATANVRADVTGPSVEEFLAELSRIRTGDVSDGEAQKARLSMRSQLVQSLSGPVGVVNTAVGLWLDGRDFDSLDQDLAKIAEMKASDINAVSKLGVQIDHGVLVLVGDKDLILGQIKDLKLPAATIVPSQ